jgi:hypothetical protein
MISSPEITSLELRIFLKKIGIIKKFIFIVVIDIFKEAQN